MCMYNNLRSQTTIKLLKFVALISANSGRKLPNYLLPVVIKSQMEEIHCSLASKIILSTHKFVPIDCCNFQLHLRALWSVSGHCWLATSAIDLCQH